MNKNKKLIRSNIDVSPEVWHLLETLKKQKKFSQFVSQAINMLFSYEYYNKGFLLEMIQRHYELCKHILRQVGSKND